MKSRMHGVLFAVGGLTLLTGLLVYRGSAFLREHEREINYANLEREALAASHLVEVHIDSLTKDLQRAVGRSLGKKEKLNTTDSPFSALALMHEEESHQWTADWLQISDALGGRATADQLENDLRGLPFASVGPKPAVFARLQDPTLSTQFVLMIPVKKADSDEQLIALGFVPGAVFSKWSEVFKGSDREVLVVDQMGYALALSEPAYVGTRLNKHPFVSEVLQDKATNGRSDTENLLGTKIIGAYEQVDNSNLYVLVDAPAPSLGAAAGQLFFQAWIFWLALSLLMGWGIWFLSGKMVSTVILPVVEPQHRKPLEVKVVAEAAPVAKVIESAAPASPPPPSETLDRTGAYRIVGPGLVQAMKGPLSVILGHAQLAHSKTSDPELRNHHEALEKEARRLRETLEALSRISGTQVSYDLQDVDVKKVIDAAITKLATEIAADKVSIVQNVEAHGNIRAAFEPLRDMFVELIKNSIEAMSGCAKKEIKIDAQISAAKIKIIIHDTGAGLSGDEVTKVFDPFYTQKSTESHAGLGLTLARGLARGFCGDLVLDSEKNKGTTVTVELPFENLANETPLTQNPQWAMKDANMIGDAPVEKSKALDEPVVVSKNEEAEEWLQMPRQLHSDEAETEIERGGKIQIRKPKVRLKV